MKMIFTPEQKTFMIESYLRNGHTVRTFRESCSAFSESLEVALLRQMEDEHKLSLI
jgi:hypothetical protein